MRLFRVALWLIAEVVIASGCGGQNGSTPMPPTTPLDGSALPSKDGPDAEVPSLDGGPSRVCVTPDAVDDGAAPAAPQFHRVAGACCPGGRPAGDAFMAGNAGTCTTDSDCTAGVNGRCTAVQIFACTYDTCFEDSDCPRQTPCMCRPSSGSGFVNACATASGCATDSDCGPGGYCSPSPSPNFDCTFGATPTYYCHTPQDGCNSDSDCGHADAGYSGTNLCLYDVQGQRWACGSLNCALP